MRYEADLELRITLTREPDDDEAEAAAEKIAGWLGGLTAVSGSGSRTRIGISKAEVTNWRTES